MFARRSRAGQRLGFSLVELLLVLSILVVLAGIAGPRFGKSSSAYRSKLAAMRVQADLDRARWVARSGSQDVVFQFTSPTTYRVSRIGQNGAEELARVDLVSEYGDVEIRGNSIGSSVTFDGWGGSSRSGTLRVHSGGSSWLLVVFEEYAPVRRRPWG